MSKLARWLPFKFRRKEKPEKSSDTAVVHPQQLMRSFFNEPLVRDPFDFAHMDRWFGDFSPARFAPSVEVSDEENAIRVTAELPGMAKEDVNLQIDEGMLIISGEKKSQTESSDNGVYRTERYFGHFQRTVPLPEEIDFERAEARFEKGVLDVRLPKTEPAPRKGRLIPVNG